MKVRNYSYSNNFRAHARDLHIHFNGMLIKVEADLNQDSKKAWVLIYQAFLKIQTLI